MSEAQYAFDDPRRVIAGDLESVSHTAKGSFVFLVQDIGREVYAYMKKPIKYTNEPLGRLSVVEDFLPPPSELVFREETEKVTIALSKRSVDFFKREARLNGTQYQRMIRALLDRYADVHATNKLERSRGG